MLADELVARGHDVTLFAKGGTISNARVVPILSKHFTFNTKPTRFARMYQNKRADLAMMIAINFIKSGNYDYIINNSLEPLPYVKLNDFPMLTILHTPATLDRVNNVLSNNWTAPENHRYVSVSESNATEWRKLLPDVGVVPNGIRLDEWQTDIQPLENTAVWAARITPEKGLHVAIEAAKQAGMKLKIAGPISDKTYFKKVIRPM
jgi:glycosyltransferase involved in cell wall biosynthesis